MNHLPTSQHAPEQANSFKGPSTASKGKLSQKPQQEFSGKGIDKLLHVVIEVNPYIAPKTQTVKWAEVAQHVQIYGTCIGHEAEKDPVNFASISGKL
jgi:hypothetical protein